MTRLQPPSEDLERRRPAWEALSDLFLDTELQDADLPYIARVIVASGYAEAEVEQILYREVYPVCRRLGGTSAIRTRNGLSAPWPPLAN